jgi:hypothetical protein
VGVELFNSNGQADRYDEVNFRNLANAPKNYVIVQHIVLLD